MFGLNLSSEDIDILRTLNFQGLVNYGDSTLTLSDAQEAIVERRSLESKDSNLIVLGPPDIKKEEIHNNLKPDILIKSIFDNAKHIKLNKTIYNRALLRMRLKNPPGKPN